MESLLDRAQILRSKLQEAWDILALETVKNEIMALEAETASPDLWNEPEHAKRELQKLADLKKEYATWNETRMSVLDTEEMLRLAIEDKDDSMTEDLRSRLDDLEARYQTLEFSLLFSGPHDAKNAIVAVHAGAGGTDAQDWAEMLLRMFVRYAESKNWQVKLVDESRGTEAGIKSVTFFVAGRYAYGHLKGEHGVHRLVRQSPFNADALRQTSFALVEVLPEVDEETEVEIKPEDLRIDTFMSGGKGGQSVNTTYSAVRIVHLPTKITVSCQNERSQMQNKETALKILKSKLVRLQEEKREKERLQLRGAYQSAEWGNQIRSYVLHPYKMVKDHRTEVESSDPEAVLNGGLDHFVEGYLRWQAASGDRRAVLNQETP